LAQALAISTIAPCSLFLHKCPAMSVRKPRKSLSQWYGPEELNLSSDAEEPCLARNVASPKSPSKRGTRQPDASKLCDSKQEACFFIGSDAECTTGASGSSETEAFHTNATPKESKIKLAAAAHTELAEVVRATCADFFYSQVSPALQSLQKSQKELDMRMKELELKVEVNQKTNANEIRTLAKIVRKQFAEVQKDFVAMQKDSTRELGNLVSRAVEHEINTCSAAKQDVNAANSDMKQTSESQSWATLQAVGSLFRRGLEKEAERQSLPGLPEEGCGSTVSNQLSNIELQMNVFQDELRSISKQIAWRSIGSAVPAADAASDAGSVAFSVTNSVASSRLPRGQRRASLAHAYQTGNK